MATAQTNNLTLPYPPNSFVDFSALGDPIDSYLTGREKGRALRQRDARDALFRDGVPRNEQGDFDHREIAARLAGIGDLQGLRDFAALAERSAMRPAIRPGMVPGNMPDGVGAVSPQRGPVGAHGTYPQFQGLSSKPEAPTVGQGLDKSPAFPGRAFGASMMPHGAHGALHTPRTRQAYAALPSGSYYIHPDGTLRQKV